MQLLKFIIFLIPFFKPSYILQISWLNNIYNVSQMLISVIIIIYFFKSKQFSKIILLILLMDLILFISSIINNLNYIDAFKNCMQTVILCIMIEMFSKNNIKKLFQALFLILNILVFIDFSFVVLHPTGIRVGLYNIWFFGAKNSHITFILPTLFINYIYLFVLKQKNAFKIFFYIITILICCYILISVQSATSIIAIALFIVLIFFSKNKFFSKLSMNLITLMYLVLFVSVVFFQFQNNFAPFFQTFFQKDVTFTGRTKIWDTTIELIKIKSIYGYGMEPSAIRVLKYHNIAALHSHNMILEIIYEGGFLLFCFFSLFWKKLCSKVDNYSKNHGQILKILLISYCVELFTEVFSFEVLLWIFVLVFEFASENSKTIGDDKFVTK